MGSYQNLSQINEELTPPQQTRTRFGNPASHILVVVINDHHLKVVQAAFEGLIDAYYCFYGSALGGRRFQKIITVDRHWAAHEAKSPSAKAVLQDWIDLLQLKLVPDNQGIHHI